LQHFNAFKITTMRLPCQGRHMPPRLSGKKWAIKQGFDNEPRALSMFGELGTGFGEEVVLLKVLL